ncbi:MAG: hypothetical protein O7D86_09940 [Proteobacteria bacterium]|nr:hypothetical protein [Pseudomonadota bacterium]
MSSYTELITLSTKTKIPVKVHPDIAPSLKFVFEASDPNVVTRSLLALNFGLKRSLVSMSAFHANALLESLIMSGRSPTAIPKALEMLRQGKAGDVVDVALRAGLKIGTIEDVGPDVFYGALKDIQSIADSTLITRPVKYTAQGVEKINRTIDNIMWDKIATGSKLAVFMKEYEKAILRNIKQHQNNPSKYRLKDKDILARDIAEFTNDAFDGLNWRRLAEGVNNKYGRDFAMAINSPSGRRVMQLLLFAPDWTIANIRILGKALPGLSRSPEQARLHRLYLARGALMFATVASGINYMFTGRPIWENEDPTKVDLGDGRKMVFSKQFVEPYHWLTEPGKTLLNKMGVLPKEGLTQALGKKYLNPGYSPPMFPRDATTGEEATARLQHAGSNLVPIFIQQIYEQGHREWRALRDIQSTEERNNMTESVAKPLEAPEEDSQDKDLLTKNNYKDNIKLKPDGNGNYVMVVKKEARDKLGIEDNDMLMLLIDQLISASHLNNVDRANGAIAMYQALEPQDDLEQLLTAQMVATHNMAMEFSKRAMLTGQPPDGINANVNRVTKLMRTFTAQVEALKKYRTGGKQTIQVQHVNVNEGGQAIVGNVKGVG